MIKQNKKIANIVVLVILFGVAAIAVIMHSFVGYIFGAIRDIIPEHEEDLAGLIRVMDIFVILLTAVATTIFLWIVTKEFKKSAAKDTEKYMAAIESASNHIVITDINGTILYANKGAEKITGYTFAEMEGNTPRLWGGLMSRDFYRDLWRTIKYERKDFFAEVKNRRKNQEEYYALMRITPIIDAQGLLEGFVVAEEDITERKRIEEDLKSAQLINRSIMHDLQVEARALARAKAKDDALLDSVGEGLVAVDINQRIMFVNKTAAVMFGWPGKDQMGAQMAKIRLEDQDGNVIPDDKKPCSVSLLTGALSQMACFFVKEDKTRLPVLVTATPIKLDEKTIGIVVAFQDMTREKELERLRLDFLSLASHQLRTPLSGTKWLIDTMRTEILGKMTSKQKEYMNYLYKINERMIALVSDMLSALRLESGAIPVSKEIISVSGFYADIISMAEQAAKGKGWVVLRNALETKEEIRIKSDPKILRTILECIIYNAINYSNQGGEVILDAKDDVGAITLSVKDTGIGIPKEEQKRIFERFYRASNAKKHKPDGTGLGLYIASVLAGKLGVQISFESEVGKGTAFYLRIPRNGV